MKRILLIATLLSPLMANAIVDLKNANYANTWTDIEVPGAGYDLKIVRTYNSRSLFNGIFGFGWCSDFETKIELNAEGNIKLTECGGGLEVTYSPTAVTKKEVDGTITNIIAKMKAEKKVGNTEAYFKQLSNELLEDDAKRTRLAKQYGITFQAKEGTKYLANGREVENFVFNKTYYTRNLPDGTSQRFNLDGQLTAIYDKSSNFIKVEYDKGQIKEVADNNGRKLFFKYFPTKKVQKITGPNNVTAEYTYTNVDDLASGKNAWGHTYKYEYDELHNLTKATWPDKTFIALKYDKKNDWVLSFTDREKCIENYVYEMSSDDPKNHYSSSAKKTCGKDVVSSSRYEFWYKTKKDGNVFLQRVQSEVNGSTTDITYNDDFGKPLSIRKNNERIAFEYFNDGLVKTKASGNVKMAFEYDSVFRKINKVSTTYFDTKGVKVSTKVTSFKYDDKGNLSFAENSDGQKITMVYDPKGRIASITDQAKKVVKIDYEERHGKPSLVTRPGLGAITVSYKPNGDINKVESKEGPTVAMQVASTFNNLLDVIAPATQELYL